MNHNAIEISGLTFAYGRQVVLNGVNLQVPQGSIFGFLGRNGAGKSTTIKILLGLLKPSGGTCRVAGLDCYRQALAVRRTVGYMAEDQQMYGWMRIEQIINWVGGFYPGWDKKLVDELLTLLELPRKSKVKTLSKGQNSRLALLLALGHSPQVVILDDPTLGLDPIARKDFLRHVINLLQSKGVTVFFSSHLLYEIEPVADHIAILEKGVIVKAARTDQLRDHIRRYLFTPRPGINLGRLTGLLDVTRTGSALALTLDNGNPQEKAALQEWATGPIQEVALNLDEIFEACIMGNRGQGVNLC